MDVVSISTFKAQCLRLLEKVAKSGEPLRVTKRGKPIVDVTPVNPQDSPRVLGISKGRIEIVGDIVAPLDERWEALADAS